MSEKKAKEKLYWLHLKEYIYQHTLNNCYKYEKHFLRDLII